MIKIDGRKTADKIIVSLRERKIQDDHLLAFVLVGNDPASRSFVERKMNITRDVLPIPTILVVLPLSSEEGKVVKVIRNLAEDEKVKGIVLQLPLPADMDRDRVIAEIPKEKDVDNLRGNSGVKSPAVKVVEEIIGGSGISISESKMVVIGAGFLTGKPIFDYFKPIVKEIFLIDKNDSREPIGEADIIISGVGKGGILKSSELKEGSIVIDFGISFNNQGKAHGDFFIDKEVRGIYTPTPGGTGPILIAKLFENYYELLEKE